MNLDILAIGAHPDDIELGCAGTLVTLVDQGYRVGLADLTDAVLATRGDRDTRSKEAENARRIIGASKRYRLGFREASIFDPNTDNLYRMVSLIRRTCPYVILAPYWEDRHPDHVDASKLVQSAVFWSGVAKFGDNQPPHRPHRVLYYFTHYEGPASLVIDISTTFDRKLKAVRSYHSQFQPQLGSEQMTYISRPEFLEKIISRARYYGSRIGAEYGEPLYVREMNRVEDLMSWANGQGVTG